MDLKVPETKPVKVLGFHDIPSTNRDPVTQRPYSAWSHKEAPGPAEPNYQVCRSLYVNDKFPCLFFHKPGLWVIVRQ